MHDVDEQRSHGGPFGEGNVWVLVPLAALSIPIFAIVADSPLALALGAVILIAAITAGVRHIVVLRHGLRMEELTAQQRLSVAERERFAAIDRLVEPDPRLPPDVRRDGPPQGS